MSAGRPSGRPFLLRYTWRGCASDRQGMRGASPGANLPGASYPSQPRTSTPGTRFQNSARLQGSTPLEASSPVRPAASFPSRLTHHRSRGRMCDNPSFRQLASFGRTAVRTCEHHCGMAAVSPHAGMSAPARKSTHRIRSQAGDGAAPPTSIGPATLSIRRTILQGWPSRRERARGLHETPLDSHECGPSRAIRTVELLA